MDTFCDVDCETQIRQGGVVGAVEDDWEQHLDGVHVVVCALRGGPGEVRGGCPA